MYSGIWHCVVWWTVASSAGDPLAPSSEWRLHSIMSQKTVRAMRTLNLISLLYISHTIFHLLWTTIFNRSIKFLAPSKRLWCYFRVWSHRPTKIPRTERYVTKYQITQSHKCCVRCLVRNNWTAKSQQWTCKHVKKKRWVAYNAMPV
jgi:hypothetical protein